MVTKKKGLARYLLPMILMFVLIFAFQCKKEVFITQGLKGGTLKTIMAWGQLTFNLNPFMSPGNRLAIASEIYESLVNIPFSGMETPLLATSYYWTKDNKILVMKLRKDVKWSDGEAFTSKDVVFTFNYIKDHKGLDQFAVWEPVKQLKKVNAISRNEVGFEFNTVNTPHLLAISKQPIVPEHIWAKINEPEIFTNNEPVGTGPFLFDKFSQENNIMYGMRNPDYWNPEKPFADVIEIRSVKDNNLCLLSMLNDEVDWSYTFVPDVKKVWVDKDPNNNRSWKPSINTVIWFMNTSKQPFSDPKFRKALAYALDKDLMSENVYQGIGAAHATGIPPGIRNEWVSDETNKRSYNYDPKKAKELLAGLGYAIKNGALHGPDNKPVREFKILVGAGWTDYIDLAQLIGDNLKVLGIRTTIDQQPWNTYYPSFQTGTYDTGIIAGQDIGPTPYYMYASHFGEIKPVGNTNFSRIVNNDILKALDAYQTTIDIKIRKKAMDVISNFMVDEVPYIPLTNATSHNLFNEKRFVGWPSDTNPYAQGAADTQEGALILSSVYMKKSVK
jgi:peptide/nickel transport system substrate-binding protein